MYIDIYKTRDQFTNFQNKDFRPGQMEAIQHILNTDKKVTVICAPTGSGKSLMGMIAGLAYKRFCYLCSTKPLQRQITEDFPEAKYMYGRGNFSCNQDPLNRTADICIHTRQTPCSLKDQCNYEVYKDTVLNHPLQILNYAYLLFEGNYVGEFSNYPIIVADEADVLEGILTNFIELKLTKLRLDTLKLSPPKYKTSIAKNGLQSWQKWAEGEGRTKIIKRLQELRPYMSKLQPDEALTNMDKMVVREYRDLNRLLSKLAVFTRYMDESWIFSEQKYKGNGPIDAWLFQPTWLTPELADRYLFQHADRFVLMSATFPTKFVLAQMLGIAAEDISYIELPSTFPVANRPVILNPVVDMSYKTFEGDLPALLTAIEDILNKHPHEKGLIHTVSWRLNSKIMKINNPRLITHTRNSIDKNNALQRVLASSNKVFVSPSSSRGVDLPDDSCRFIIIAKAPYQRLGDKLVSSRVNGSGGIGKYWYRAICAQDIVQASGRGVRHKDDYCTTYVLDKRAKELIVNNQSLFPRYWMEAVDII